VVLKVGGVDTLGKGSLEKLCVRVSGTVQLQLFGDRDGAGASGDRGLELLIVLDMRDVLGIVPADELRLEQRGLETLLDNDDRRALVASVVRLEVLGCGLERRLFLDLVRVDTNPKPELRVSVEEVDILADLLSPPLNTQKKKKKK